MLYVMHMNSLYVITRNIDFLSHNRHTFYSQLYSTKMHARSNSSKIIIIGLIIFTQASMIFLVIHITVSSYKQTNCPGLFQRPHEQHKIRIRPQKHSFPFHELMVNDYNKLINITNFQFLINQEDACTKSNVFLLILIPSAPQNIEKRRSIRETWGEKREGVLVFFMLGTSVDNITERTINEESELYDDIIKGNFLDSYKNLTYKSIMSLKYVIYYCSQATYILKTDDDSFVNMPLLINFLKHDLSPFGAENLLLCNDMTGSLALRDPKSKWYVPKEDFSAEFYPSYCSGWYAIFSPDICFKLYKESQKLRYLFVDDAFVYGMAARNANVTHRDISEYTLAYRNINLFKNGTYGKLNILFGTPNMSPNLIREFYKIFKGKQVPESIYNKNI